MCHGNGGECVDAAHRPGSQHAIPKTQILTVMPCHQFQRMEVLQNAAVTLSGLLDDSKIVEYSSSSFHDGHTLFSFSEQYDFNRSAWFRTAHIPDGSYGCL